MESLESRILLTSDFGDAPNPYPTLLADGGPSHQTGSGLMIGTSVDSELDGHPHGLALGDDGSEPLAGVNFDPVVAGALDATVTVHVQGGVGKLDAWIDFDDDGSWGGPGEQIADSLDVVVGDNVVTFDVPASALTNHDLTYARFRLSSAGGLGVGGAAADGEVEDVALRIESPDLASGFFGGPHAVANAALGRRTTDAADLDDDGDMDFITVSYFSNTVSWHENDGNQNFTEHTVSTVPHGPTDLIVSDLDGDGDRDLVGSSTFDNTVAWYENDGSQSFTRHVVSSLARSATSVFAVDLDSDGDIDLISGNGNANNLEHSVTWYRNDGNQNFQQLGINNTQQIPVDVVAGDVDNDGDIDVVAASTLDDTIALYRNDGSEVFVQEIVTSTADRPESLALAHMNFDLSVDIVSASRGDGKIAWYEGPTSHNVPLAEHVITTTANGVDSVVAVDFNGDEYVDVVSTSPTDNTIAWYDGSDGFAMRTISTVATGVSDPLVADVNSDGMLDVIATQSGGTATWYESLPAFDYGDAPAPYDTLQNDGGPVHAISLDLHLGARVDADLDGQPDPASHGDDADGQDDDDGVVDPLDLQGTVGTTPTVTVTAFSTLFSTATLAGWIDFNGDGVFDNNTERATALVNNNGRPRRYALTFPEIPVGAQGTTQARFRLSSDPAFIANPSATGAASDGEVEDYAFTITIPGQATVANYQQLSTGLGGLPAGLLDSLDYFGTSVASLGDLDGDGVNDLAVGASNDENTVGDHGAVYILLMNTDGTVRTYQKITDGLGGLPSGVLDFNDHFGTSVASLGDFDGDGVNDLVVGATQGGGANEGAAYILFLNSDGTLKSHLRIADGEGGLPAGTLDPGGRFGHSLTSPGDLDGNGVPDLAVGAYWSDLAGESREGAVHILFMNSDGTVEDHQLIADGFGGLPAGIFEQNDEFGSAVASPGDLDGNGVADLAVGAWWDSATPVAAGGTPTEGAVYILFMNIYGTVLSHQKIADGLGGLPAGTVEAGDFFGASIAALGDLDGDGVADLAVGATGDDASGVSEGTVFVLLMNPDGTVRSHDKIGDGLNGLPAGSIDTYEDFGRGVASLGDLDGDGIVELAVGVAEDFVTDHGEGSVWILNLSPAGVAGPLSMSHVAGRDSSSGDWWVARSDGNSFTNHNAGFWDPNVGWLDVHTADVNGDGFDDVVGRDPASGDWWVGLADTNGNFINQNWGVWDATVNWLDVNVADVDGDGNDDIVGRQQSNGNWWVALSDGVGGFTNQLHGFWDPTVTWLDVNVADVNGDGYDDVVGRQQSNGNWWVGVSDGLGDFTNQLHGYWDPTVTWVDVNIADVNGDGNDDVIGRQDSNGNWWVSVSDGAGSFTNQLWGNFTAIPWDDVTVADVNGDGNDDVVARQQSNGNWWVGLSDGVGAFTNQQWGYWDPSIAWLDVSFGDVDGDGDDDIIGREQSNGRWWVGRSDGAGSFSNELWGTWDPAVAWTDVALLDDLLAV